MKVKKKPLYPLLVLLSVFTTIAFDQNGNNATLNSDKTTSLHKGSAIILEIVKNDNVQKEFAKARTVATRQILAIR